MAWKKQRVDVKNATIVKRNEYVRILNDIMAAGFCPFCEKHLFKHHRRPITYKGRYWIVTENSWPYSGSRHHFLFVTRAHIESIENLSTPAWTELQRLYRTLMKDKKMKGATLMIRSGDTKITGASVRHLHAHIIAGTPRTKRAKPIRALVSFKK